MHFVQALAALTVGGSELVAAELTEFLRQRGHRVTVLGAPGPLSARIKAASAEALEWPIGRKRLSTLKYLRRLTEWLEQTRPDVLHVHSRLPAWICHLAIRRIRPASRPLFITSVHGQYTVSPYSAVMARGDRVIAVSDHIRDFTLDNYTFVDPARIVTIHGGTSRSDFPHGYKPPESWHRQIDKEFPELRNRRILLMPGRLSRYKGHPAFLELISDLAEDHPDVHGVIAGPGRPGSRYLAELEGFAERSGILDRITFIGVREDIRDWMAAAEIVFNLCSDPPEAFGRTVPEALHLGVPVIAWNHGGVSETLAAMFPAGAVRPDSRGALLQRARAFLDKKPVVPDSEAFRLSESMQKTFDLYQAALKERA